MKFSKCFKKFVYELFYPSLLGSMIFQFISELFKPPKLSVWPNEILIIIIYVTDWFFIKFYLPKKVIKEINSISFYQILDLFIPTFFTIAFFCIPLLNPILFCSSLFAAFLLMDFYLCKSKYLKFIFVFMSLIILTFLILNILNVQANIIILNILLTVIYIVIAILSHHDKTTKKRHIIRTVL